MKRLFCIAVFGMTFHAASAQSESDQSETTQNTQTLWTAPKAACDAYNADKEASQGTTSSYMQQTYDSNHTDESRETRLRDAVMPILCNPPTRSTNDSEGN